MITQMIKENFNFMVITGNGEKYRSYNYDRVKRVFEDEGGRLYAYAYLDAKHTIKLLIEWK